MTITAKDIEALLAQKHSGDVFVPECKDGPTTMGSHLRMDVWAMNRSWTRACVSAYEIKVSRSDFLQDEKWPGYLPLCNRFAFVCPHGVIQPEELPPEVGLFWVAKTGTRLFTKRKPPHRSVEIPERVFRYILMCRATIKSSWAENGDQESSREFWERWLQEKQLNADLGRRVSRGVSEVIRDQIYEVELENRRLKQRCDGFDDIRQLLSDLGIDPSANTFTIRSQLRAKMEEAGGAVPKHLPGRLLRLGEDLQRVSDELEKISVQGATNRSETA